MAGELPIKFTIETKLLHEALGIASVAVDSRLSLPILGNVKIEAGDKISLTTTNLDLFVEQLLPSKGKVKPGAVTVPFDLLHRLTGRLTSTETEMELAGKILKIRSGEINAILETLPEDEFPPMPKQKTADVDPCDVKELLIPLKKVHHAMSIDASRYHLCGVNLNGPQFIASDGRRIAVFTGREFSKESVIVPSIFVKAMLKIEPAGKIAVLISDGLISVQNMELKVFCKLVEAQYPTGAKTASEKKPGKHIFGCDRTELIEALKTCAIFRDGIMNALTMSGRGNEIEISKDDKIKAMVMGCELAGQPELTKRFNSNFLLDALGVLEEKAVTIHCEDSDATLLIQEGAFKTVIQGLLMPE